MKINGRRNKVINIEIPEENNVVDLTLRRAVNANDNVYISYTDPNRNQKRNVVQDQSGNDLENIISFEAINITRSVNRGSQRLYPSEDLFSEIIAVDPIP